MEIITIILGIVTIYLLFRKNPSNYFLQISFDWKDIYKILELSEDEQSGLKINPDFYYQSPNGNNGEGLGIDEISANFEYYISPDSLRNGSYPAFSTIYDQQLKRFFETPNTWYRGILSGKTKKDEELWIGCLFSKFFIKNKSAFCINFSSDGTILQKTLVILFDCEYLNIKNIHQSWGNQIPFEAYIIEKKHSSDSIVKNIVIAEKTVFWIGTNVQSFDDAQSAPFSQDMYKFLKNNPENEESK